MCSRQFKLSNAEQMIATTYKPRAILISSQAIIFQTGWPVESKSDVLGIAFQSEEFVNRIMTSSDDNRCPLADSSFRPSVVFYALIPIHMIFGDVEYDGTVWIQGRSSLELEARQLQYITVGLWFSQQLQCRTANISTNQNIPIGSLSQATDQCRNSAFPV